MRRPALNCQSSAGDTHCDSLAQLVLCSASSHDGQSVPQPGSGICACSQLHHSLRPALWLLCTLGQRGRSFSMHDMLEPEARMTWF